MSCMLILWHLEAKYGDQLLLIFSAIDRARWQRRRTGTNRGDNMRDIPDDFKTMGRLGGKR